MTYALTVYPALYTALNGTLTWAVYDDVPDGTAPPYIKLGDVIETPLWHLGQPGGTTAVQIHGWSSYAGKLEVMQMLDELNTALNGQTFALGGGQTMMRCALDNALTLEEKDPTHMVTHYHLIATYRIDVEA